MGDNVFTYTAENATSTYEHTTQVNRVDIDAENDVLQKQNNTSIIE